MDDRAFIVYIAILIVIVSFMGVRFVIHDIQAHINNKRMPVSISSVLVMFLVFGLDVFTVLGLFYPQYFF